LFVKRLNGIFDQVDHHLFNHVPVGSDGKLFGFNTDLDGNAFICHFFFVKLGHIV
jgi:hypothetical protein